MNKGFRTCQKSLNHVAHFEPQIGAGARGQIPPHFNIEPPRCTVWTQQPQPSSAHAHELRYVHLSAAGACRSGRDVRARLAARAHGNLEGGVPGACVCVHVSRAGTRGTRPTCPPQAPTIPHQLAHTSAMKVATVRPLAERDQSATMATSRRHVGRSQPRVEPVSSTPGACSEGE